MRFPVTQAIAAGAEIAYRSAQHLVGQDWLVEFGAGLKRFKLFRRNALVLVDRSMHQALTIAIRGSQIMLVP